MADYLILRKEDPTVTGPSAWRVVNLIRNKTADVAGGTEALREAYIGPGKYGICRADTGRTVILNPNPQVIDDPTVEW